MPSIKAEIDQLYGEERLTKLLEKVSIESIDDIHGAAMNIRHIAGARGMRVALCADISSAEPMADANGTSLNAEIFGWVSDQQRWWEDHRLALHSPLPHACRYESEPFWCNAEGFHGVRHNPFLDEIDVSRYFTGFRKKYPIVLVPVHLPFGQVSANSFTPIAPKTEDLTEEFARYGELFGLITRRFISGYVSVMRKSKNIPQDCGLSKREVECLRWAALGKTDKEIGAIISLSPSTVRYHIQRAGDKLNSVNRGQTIFKSGQLGYLGANG